MEGHRGAGGAGRVLGRLLEAVLGSRGEANAVFDILAALQSEDPEEIQEAVRICSRLFGALLERGDLFVGRLPSEEAVMTGSQGATRKYKVWMRHRYRSCCNRLGELLAHPSFQVKEVALGTLMKFVQLEGSHPLEKPKWEGNYLFPRELFKLVMEGLLSVEEDRALLLSQFQEYLEYDDVRYHTMQEATGAVARATDGRAEVPLAFWNNAFTLLSAVSLPCREGGTPSYYVKYAEPSDKWKVAHLKEHRKAFQLMWLSFLKHKLPVSLYKKVLVIMRDSILPHLAQPTLMMDFLTSAYDIGGAISLLALNGLFVLIHQHNLHLPAYLVAAFAKRLSRLALTAPPEALLMVLPFICNLLRRHPACRVLIHRPQDPELDMDPYDPGEQDPARSHALESSLWELQALQKHYHPEVSKAASVINQVLCVPETSIAPLLELTPYEVFERDLKKKVPEPVPLEFIPPAGLLGRQEDLCAQYFSLS
ncbi:nucleolar complex protein 4 homolog isoform X2 [Loxodonta africana]|uniref:nucleolar complex protein 4 homolog isoform X2 n=1 Tax=Loxodonta africana TaxID=9785 RepID=UPI0030D58B4F